MSAEDGVPAAENLRAAVRAMRAEGNWHYDWRLRVSAAADLLDAIDALHQPEHPDPDNFPS